MRPANLNSAVPTSNQKTTRPPLLASIPIPISSRQRLPAPPPSSPVRYHRSSQEDDLVFAMSPDQNTPPTNPFLSRTLGSYSEPRKFSSSLFMQKYINDHSIPRPFLNTKPVPYPEEPFMYSVPTIKRPQTPKRRTSSNSSTTAVTTPTARRHALLKPHVSSGRPPRSSATCSSSQTSEDESDLFPNHAVHPLTSAFRRSVSATTSATTSTASSSPSSSVDVLLPTAPSSYPLFSEDDIIAVEGNRKPKRSATTGMSFFSRMRNALPSPSLSPHQHQGERCRNYADGVGEANTSSLGLEKYFREIVYDRAGSGRMKPSVVEVSRGRPRERKVSRGINIPGPISAEKGSS